MGHDCRKVLLDVLKSSALEVVCDKIVLSKVLYFDDRMKYNPPSVDLPNAIIQSLEHIFPAEEHHQALSWLQLDKFHRFDMPRQPKDGSHQSSGSRGVGVILAARDLINYANWPSMELMA